MARDPANFLLVVLHEAHVAIGGVHDVESGERVIRINHRGVRDRVGPARPGDPLKDAQHSQVVYDDSAPTLASRPPPKQRKELVQVQRPVLMTSLRWACCPNSTALQSPMPMEASPT